MPKRKCGVERRAMAWLSKKYDKVKYRWFSSPDFIINNRGYEARLLFGKGKKRTVIFAEGEFNNLEDGVTVLLFDREGDEPVAEIPMKELRMNTFAKDYLMKGNHEEYSVTVKVPKLKSEVYCKRETFSRLKKYSEKHHIRNEEETLSRLLEIAEGRDRVAYARGKKIF